MPVGRHRFAGNDGVTNIAERCTAERFHCEFALARIQHAAVMSTDDLIVFNLIIF
jgi:hypothetical protein